MAPLAILDAPLDCSGAGRAEEHAPAALRAAGIVERLGARDAGEADARIDDPRRDPATGVIGAAAVRRATAAIAARVGASFATPARCRSSSAATARCCWACSRRCRAAAACGSWTATRTSTTGRARRPARRPTWSSRSSPAMAPLLEAPLVDPADVVLLGHRPDELHPDVARGERAPRPGDPGADRARGARARRRRASGARPQPSSRTARPGCTSTSTCSTSPRCPPSATRSRSGSTGTSWSRSPARSSAAPNLLGVSVADFNPDRDPEGVHAARIVEALEALWA